MKNDVVKERNVSFDNRVIRVFISSTFRDMQDERDELMKKTFPVLRQKAAERDVTLTELEPRWGITPEKCTYVSKKRPGYLVVHDHK